MFIYKSNIIKKKWHNTAIFVTPYPLLIYLLLKDLKEIQSTLFFFTNSFANKININYINTICIEDKYEKNKNSFIRAFFKIYMRFLAKTKWHHISDTNIFCQDHFPISYCLTGSNYYNLVEDGVANYVIDNSKKLNVYGYKRKVYKLLYGPQSLQPSFGKSIYVKKIILTNLLKIPEILGDKVESHSINDMWNSSSLEKKEFILNVFGLSNNDVQQAKLHDILILSTPSNEIYSEEYLVEKYKEIINGYDTRRILIKAHPRNNINLIKYFPEVSIITKPFPIEILNLLGCEFKVIYSHRSTASYNLKLNARLIEI